ncbi:protein sel-1 homolog 3 isoform X3 [Leuresthes tenuis]|uniref:protein sel-1 homolog 3 isoform X3 n=1 Tax=Leuresthes tenuis TaxID=355514 RepID=UPI003B502A48
MKGFQSIIFGYVLTSSFLMGPCALLAISAQSGDTLPDNFIGFDSVPDKVADGSVVRVRYQCFRPCHLAVEVVVSTLRKTDLVVFRRKWISSAPRVYRIQQVLLRLPPSISHHPKFFSSNMLDTQNVTVRAWLDYIKKGSEISTYHSSMLKIYKVLQVMPVSQRMSEPPTGCPSWSAQLIRQMTTDRIHQCPHETDVIDMLKFPMASTGEHFGVVRRFQPFISGALERARVHAVTQPRFQNSIYFDDTDGYFVIGGGKYMPGIYGYFGPINYYRFGTEEVKNQLHPESILRGLEGAHKECREIRTFTKAFLQEVTKTHLLSTTNQAVCTPDFLRLWDQFGKKEKTCTQAWTWETHLKHNTFFHFLLRKQDEIRAGSLGIKHLRTSLFDLAVGTMFPVVEGQRKITNKSIALLEVSSCFGNHRASLFLATTHLSGLGHSVSQEQGHVYSLIGALADERFALMHAAYKHTQGTDGFPKDLNMAYGYYSNAGAQTNIDTSRGHGNKQYTPEYIYLSNEEDLYSLMHETSDVFQYLKFQAERGDIESQKRLGTMLYWGQNGISKDLVSAVKWFERSAMQMKDPSATYDYSILLMKGQGVKRNYTRGFQLLKKAAAMGSINALNGLGWFHGIVLNDHKNAVKYFEQAALNGSDDGMFNLGIYHLNGKNPEKPWRNESAAFQQFLSASRLGHVAASVEAAWYLSTGGLEGVSQDVERAVIMLKKVCEQNGHLGFIIREALQAYLQGSWREAFVKYVLAAETGLGLAQSNAAHLCEELNLSNDCQWRYLNYSILNSDPHPFSLLKMGDYYFNYFSSSTQEDSLSMAEQAISMYSRAALAGNPQGMFSLAVLAKQGHIFPPSVLGLFEASRRDEPDSVVEKILKRCVQAEDEEAITPCSLALLGLQTGKALRRMTQNRAQLFLAYASLLSILVIVITVPLHSCLEHRYSAFSQRRRTSSVSHQGVDSNRERGGIVGRAYRAAENSWLTMNGEQWLRQTSDLAVTLSGVCLCAFWTALLYHLL